MSKENTGPTMNGNIKTEPVATLRAPSQRLQGFKVPRDLSLGASKPATKDSARGAATGNKKVFTPNLNVIRNKGTASEPTTPSGRNQKNSKSERGRGRGGQTSTRGRGKTCIQTTGLFSEGIAGQPTRRANQGRPSYNEPTVASVLRRPTLVKSSGKVDDKLELQSLKDLMDDEDDDSDKMNTMVNNADFNVPIVLKDAKCATLLDQPKKYPASLQDFFQGKQPELFLIQLPDTLPGQGNEVAEVKKGDEKTGKEGQAEGEQSQEQNYCLMKGLQEGLIGKFVRYKSGKTKLVLGNTRFDADLGLDPGFLQEVVSVRTNPTERNGDMINLGKISAKVNVSPDWEEMFQSMTS